MSRSGLLPQADTDHKRGVKLGFGTEVGFWAILGRAPEAFVVHKCKKFSITDGLLNFVVNMYGQLVDHPEKFLHIHF